MDSWEAVDFPRVREMLAGWCRTPMGAEHARRLHPFASRQAADDELDRLVEIVALDGEPTLGTAVDIRPLLERVRTGGALSGEELLVVGRTVGALAACRRFLDERRERMPLTGPELAMIDGDEHLAAEIVSALDETGMVVDSASAELAGIRRELRNLRGRLVRRLETLMAEHPDWFGDRPTIRHDRHVVPVRVEHRERMAGVVHESSGTGQTLFIEPRRQSRTRTGSRTFAAASRRRSRASFGRFPTGWRQAPGCSRMGSGRWVGSTSCWRRSGLRIPSRVPGRADRAQNPDRGGGTRCCCAARSRSCRWVSTCPRTGTCC